jgi:hypothetical protein
MGVTKAKQRLYRAAKLYVAQATLESETELLKASECYSREVTRARNKRDKWRAKKHGGVI